MDLGTPALTLVEEAIFHLLSVLVFEDLDDLKEVFLEDELTLLWVPFYSCHLFYLGPLLDIVLRVRLV